MAAKDIRFILSRIRPDAGWGWKGGAQDDMAQVRWRDLVQVEPTQAEYDAEQLVIDAEDVLKASTRVGQVGRANSLVGVLPDDFNQNELKNAVEELLVRAGALDAETGVVLPVNEWDEESV